MKEPVYSDKVKQMSARVLTTKLKQRFILSNPTREKNHLETGFTLIELLVVIAIIGILTSIAVSSYNTFNRNQTVRIAALDLKSDLRLAKTDASAGKKDQVCRDNDSNGRDDYSLIGHFVTLEAGSNTITKGQRCRANGPYSPDPVVVNSIIGKRLSQGASIADISAIDNSGNPCSSYGAGAQITVEFYTVTVTDPSGMPSSTLAEPNTSFYAGAVADGVVPTPSDPCLGAMEGIRLTITSRSTDQYYLFIHNNGNVYERKV